MDDDLQSLKSWILYDDFDMFCIPMDNRYAATPVRFMSGCRERQALDDKDFECSFEEFVQIYAQTTRVLAFNWIKSVGRPFSNRLKWSWMVIASHTTKTHGFLMVCQSENQYSLNDQFSGATVLLGNEAMEEDEEDSEF